MDERIFVTISPSVKKDGLRLLTKPCDKDRSLWRQPLCGCPSASACGGVLNPTDEITAVPKLLDRLDIRRWGNCGRNELPDGDSAEDTGKRGGLRIGGKRAPKDAV